MSERYERQRLQIRNLTIAACVLLGSLCLIYLPDLGRGFIKDDFMWIRTGRVASVRHAPELLGKNVGFYRPVVSGTFALNYATAGLNPYPYGLTNFALLISAAVLVFVLAHRLGLPGEAALLAAAVWVFNFHGINMAVLWLSGRTALLLCVASLCATLGTIDRRPALAAAFCFLALLSKEEAVVLPLLMTAFASFSPAVAPANGRTAHASTWPLFAALAIYAILRVRSGAFGPADAPSYYQFTFSASHVLRNVAEYLDRAVTWPAAVTVILWATARSVPRLDGTERRVLVVGALWFLFGYALTVFLPVRSSLYSVFPSIGACLAAGAVAAALMRRGPTRCRRCMTALVMLPVLLLPVYRARNVRWVVLADLSSKVLRVVRHAAETAGERKRVILIDDPTARFNMEATFGTLFPDGIALTLGDRFQGAITRGSQALSAADLNEAVVLAFRDGTLAPLPAGPRSR